MKIHKNQLLEILLEAYRAGYKTGSKEELLPFMVWYEQNQSKILASSEPKPLAKNKQTERVCPHCGKCEMNYDYDGSYLNWECKTFP